MVEVPSIRPVPRCEYGPDAEGDHDGLAANAERFGGVAMIFSATRVT